jgi:hypothetical protein
MLASADDDFTPHQPDMQSPNSSDQYNPSSELEGGQALHHPQPQLPVNGVTLHFPSQGSGSRGFHLPPIVAPPMTFDTSWQLSPATAQMAYDMVFNRQPSPRELSSTAMRPQVIRMQEGLGQLTSLGEFFLVCCLTSIVSVMLVLSFASVTHFVRAVSGSSFCGHCS